MLESLHDKLNTVLYKLFKIQLWIRFTDPKNPKWNSESNCFKMWEIRYHRKSGHWMWWRLG